MNKEWQWLVQYIAVIVLAVVLAAALGSMDLFEQTTLGKKLTAANIVQFLGYGAALAVFWLVGRRTTVTLHSHGGRWSFLQHLVLPLVTLLVVAGAHSVILIVLKRAMDASQRNLYNWFFIAGIIASAAWLVAALFKQSSPLTEAVTNSVQRADAVATATCPQCGTQTTSQARFCSSCGHAIGS